ncbi:MAG: glucosamine-6-phosphate deaminase, partial [Oscillospiraceae bacterium]
EDSCRKVAEIIEEVVANKPDALLGLATGSSALGVYDALKADFDAKKVDFSKCRTVNLDEYVGLPQSHDQSYSYFMHKNLFDRTNFDESKIFLIDGEKNGDDEAKRMGDFLAKNYPDMQLLGIGPNGHIGFNEPADVFEMNPHVTDLTKKTIDANARFFASVNDVPQKAITMGIGNIALAKKTVLIAAGDSKAEVLGRLFKDDVIDPQLPCSILKIHPDAIIVADKALAKKAGLL